MNNPDKAHRVEIFQQTVEIVKLGRYVLNGKHIAVDKTEIAANTEFFNEKFSLKECQSSQNTKFSVIEADCLEVAELLLKAGFESCVLNMASRRNPGGGVLNGSGAQEENLFRRSNLFCISCLCHHKRPEQLSRTQSQWQF